MRGEEMRMALHALARNFDELARPEQGRYVDEPARAGVAGTTLRPAEALVFYRRHRFLRQGRPANIPRYKPLHTNTLSAPMLPPNTPSLPWSVRIRIGAAYRSEWY